MADSSIINSTIAQSFKNWISWKYTSCESCDKSRYTFSENLKKNERYKCCNEGYNIIYSYGTRFKLFFALVWTYQINQAAFLFKMMYIVINILARFVLTILSKCIDSKGKIRKFSYLYHAIKIM